MGKNKNGQLNDGVFVSQYFNPVGFDNIGDDYLTAIRQLDITQNCNKYKWKNLPKHLSSWLIELMLYARGSLCGFVYAGELKILPFTSIGSLNEVGLFTKVKPMSYNGFIDRDGDNTSNIPEIPVFDGREKVDLSAAILFDNYPFINTSYKAMPRFVLNDKFVKWQ